MKHPSLIIKGTKSKRLDGKKIVLAMTGSVAAIKSFELCRELMRRGAEVKVVMSKAAEQLISKDMMEYASGNPVITELTGKIEHVELFGIKGSASLLLIAPATANTISKIAMAIDDTPVPTMATTAIGSRTPIIIAPAMHYSMYKHPIVQENLVKLTQKGFIKLVQPMIEEDKAKFAGIEQICLECERALSKKTLDNRKILVVSGKSHEKVDDVRVLTTLASGKTGLDIAKEAYRKGAEVCLIHNEVSGLAFSEVKAESYTEFFDATMKELKKGYDIFICPAALNDFHTEKKTGKIKSDKGVNIKLLPNRKLLKEIRKSYPTLFMVGFKAETVSGTKLESAARKSLKENRLQIVVANDVKKNPMGSKKSEVLILAGKKKIRVKGNKEKIASKLVAVIQ